MSKNSFSEIAKEYFDVPSILENCDGGIETTVK